MNALRGKVLFFRAGPELPLMMVVRSARPVSRLEILRVLTICPTESEQRNRIRSTIIHKQRAEVSSYSVTSQH